MLPPEPAPPPPLVGIEVIDIQSDDEEQGDVTLPPPLPPTPIALSCEPFQSSSAATVPPSQDQSVDGHRRRHYPAKQDPLDNPPIHKCKCGKKFKNKKQLMRHIERREK